MFKQLLLICLGMFIYSCASVPLRSGQEKIVEGKIPSWINNWHSKDSKIYKAFVGQSYKHTTDTDAKEFALDEAKKKAAEYFWGEEVVKEIVKYTETKGLTKDIFATNLIRNESLQRKNKGYIFGEESEYSVQKYETVDSADNSQYFYKAQVLFLVDKEKQKNAYAEMLKQLAQQQKVREAQDKINQIVEYLQKEDANNLFGNSEEKQ